jgi:PleD family two-component response regulator
MKLAKLKPRWLNAETHPAHAPQQDTPAQNPFHLLQMPETPDSLWEKIITSDKPRILIVDSKPTATLLARIMAPECQIQAVPSAADILETARHPDQRPDLILLDNLAPIREGLEICRQLKEDETTQSIPVMLIIDRDNAEDEVQALRLGAEDCITCPFRLDVVEARIRNQLRIKIRNDLLEHYANQDSLTDVANRRGFDLALSAEWLRAIREQHRLSLVMVDVDCFKQFNDLYGHREGDHCLRRGLMPWLRRSPALATSWPATAVKNSLPSCPEPISKAHAGSVNACAMQ